MSANHRDTAAFSRTLLLGAAIVLLGLVGCASDGKKVTDPADALPNEFAGAPGWVTRGCAAFPGDDDKKRICGVGAMGGTANPSIARKAAVGRARTDIARTLQTKVTAMLKDYESTTTGGDEFGDAAADEQHIVDVSKQITELTLSGTEMRDLWVSQSGTFYALVVLDVEKFQDSVAEMDNLSENIRKAVQERSADAFAELDEATGE